MRRRLIATLILALAGCTNISAPANYTPVPANVGSGSVARETVSLEGAPYTVQEVAARATRTPAPRRPFPNLEDYWNGQATFVVEIADTQLPMGESDSLVMPNGEWWSYAHASSRSAGVKDQCGAPVEFPGCVVLYKSKDGGYNFDLDSPAVCLNKCEKCPCTSTGDYIDQQQYPRVVRGQHEYLMVYEYRATTQLLRSRDGRTWSDPVRVADTIIWNKWYQPCASYELIGKHPFAKYVYDCLAGAPPGVYTENGVVYVFVATGSNPGSMSCFFGTADQPPSKYQPCRSNPLFKGAPAYGPLDLKGPETNAYFDFRYLSSAEVVKVNNRFYMLYEGVRGPGPGDPGDTQFGLGLARSHTNQIDGKWEKFGGNPILVDLPGNIGLGHADLVVHDGQTILFTSLDGNVRSRLALVWK
jgi:hypothetical protein